MKRAAILCWLLAIPAFAQDDMEAQLEACFAGADLDAVGARADAFAAARDVEARVAALCAAGDAAGALAFVRDVEADFYAGDAEAARMRACLVDALGEEAVATNEAC